MNTAPSARVYAAYFQLADQLYVFGGYGVAGLLPSVWALDLTLSAWRLVPTDAAAMKYAPLCFAAVVSLPNTKTAFLFGGLNLYWPVTQVCFEARPYEEKHPYTLNLLSCFLTFLILMLLPFCLKLWRFDAEDGALVVVSDLFPTVTQILGATGCYYGGQLLFYGGAMLNGYAPSTLQKHSQSPSYTYLTDLWVYTLHTNSWTNWSQSAVRPRNRYLASMFVLQTPGSSSQLRMFVARPGLTYLCARGRGAGFKDCDRRDRVFLKRLRNKTKATGKMKEGKVKRGRTDKDKERE